MKVKNIFICEKCGHESPKWQGRCPDCQEWNSFKEETQMIAPKNSSITSSRHEHKAVIKPISLNDHSQPEAARIKTRFDDLNTVLGGGIKTGSLILLSGEPGIGKSTLTLELCADAVSEKNSILYISGEESAEQIASRARRLNIKSDYISIFPETCLENIFGEMELEQPKLIVIDSIQVIYSLDIGSLPGSLSQIRYCTEKLMENCKSKGITCIIVGHVNKEGELAGPKVLEHLVDTVLFIDGERHQQLRLIRGLKNRFGSTNEIAIMEMNEKGLSEVKNPSELFLEGRRKNAVGSAITVTLEGSRPLLLEIQALTNTTVFGYPKRTANGYDMNRLQMLAAVLQKHLKINTNGQDIFVNVVGGFRLQETSVDLSVAMSIISSYKKLPLPENTVFLGEIGLSGELRPVSHLEKRVKEAFKLGFKNIITTKVPAHLTRQKDCKIISAGDLEEASKLIFT